MADHRSEAPPTLHPTMGFSRPTRISPFLHILPILPILPMPPTLHIRPIRHIRLDVRDRPQRKGRDHVSKLPGPGHLAAEEVNPRTAGRRAGANRIPTVGNAPDAPFTLPLTRANWPAHTLAPGSVDGRAGGGHTTRSRRGRAPPRRPDVVRRHHPQAQGDNLFLLAFGVGSTGREFSGDAVGGRAARCARQRHGADPRPQPHPATASACDLSLLRPSSRALLRGHGRRGGGLVRLHHRRRLGRHAAFGNGGAPGKRSRGVAVERRGGRRQGDRRGTVPGRQFQQHHPVALDSRRRERELPSCS